MTDQFITLTTAARLYGYTETQLRGMARRGTLPGATKTGRRWRVHLETLKEAWKPKPYTPTPADYGVSLFPPNVKPNSKGSLMPDPDSFLTLAVNGLLPDACAAIIAQAPLLTHLHKLGRLRYTDMPIPGASTVTYILKVQKPSVFHPNQGMEPFLKPLREQMSDFVDKAAAKLQTAFTNGYLGEGAEDGLTIQGLKQLNLTQDQVLLYAADRQLFRNCGGIVEQRAPDRLSIHLMGVFYLRPLE